MIRLKKKSYDKKNPKRFNKKTIKLILILSNRASNLFFDIARTPYKANQNELSSLTLNQSNIKKSSKKTNEKNINWLAIQLNSVQNPKYFNVFLLI